MEEINIESTEGKDKIESIEETDEEVIIYYNDKSGKISKISVPRNIIDWVGKWIDGCDIGIKHKSIELYQDFIIAFDVKSSLYTKYVKTFREAMQTVGFDNTRIAYVLEELDKDKEISLMNFKEFIGTRKVETAKYFQVWSAIRYWKAKGKCLYNSRGTITREI